MDDNQDKMAYLKSTYLMVDRDDEKIQQLMNLKDDIEKKLLIQLRDKWPFLREKKYLLNRYETLMCKSNFKENFVSNAKGSVTVFE